MNKWLNYRIHMIQYINRMPLNKKNQIYIIWILYNDDALFVNKLCGYKDTS